MEKEIEATHEITSRTIDSLSSAQLKLMKENSRLQEIISKKDKEIEDLSNPPPHLWMIQRKSYQVGSMMI